MLSVGTHAPDFDLPALGSRRLRLSQALAGKPVVLFFYPKDFTRTCTAEVCGFRDLYPTLEAMGIALLGISRDDVATHDRFAARHNVPVELLTDASGQVCKAYDARVPILGLPKRVTYLLGPDHRILWAVQDFTSADAHTEGVLAYIQRQGLDKAWAAAKA